MPAHQPPTDGRAYIHIPLLPVHSDFIDSIQTGNNKIDRASPNETLENNFNQEEKQPPKAQGLAFLLLVAYVRPSQDDASESPTTQQRASMNSSCPRNQHTQANSSFVRFFKGGLAG